jgi:light-regulated signal transduction histidine kinase (bacteriophytochrome)
MDGLRVRVLLIEDDEEDYILVQDLFSEISPSRFNLEWASTYEAALTAMERERYDVYLLDYRLGNRNGLEVLRELKERGFTTPIILLTGFGDYDVDIEAMRAGAADYLVKDQLSSPLLERSIRYAIERNRSEEALRKARDELERRVYERTEALAKANRDLHLEIAERKRAEEALRESAEKLKLFAYSVAHDLKSPVIGIYGLTRLLHKHYKDVLDERGMHYCKQILKVSQHVVALVEKINIFAATKEAPLQVERVDIRHMVGAMREEFYQQLRFHRVNLIGPETAAEIKADRLLILRLFRNLIDNSLKYGGTLLSRINIGYEESDAFHMISVSDDGVGVKQEDFEKLFGLFQRNSTSEGIEGSGLGLAIVKEIAARHQGRVWIEPGIERGITFCITISKHL